jgi:hypothetical protein
MSGLLRLNWSLSGRIITIKVRNISQQARRSKRKVDASKKGHVGRRVRNDVASNVQTVSVQTREGPVGQETGENTLPREEEVLIHLDRTVIIEWPVISSVHNRTALDNPRDPGVRDTTQKAGRRRCGWGGAGNASEKASRVGDSTEEATDGWDAAEETTGGGCGDSVGNASKKTGGVGEAAQNAGRQSSSKSTGRQSSTDEWQGTESGGRERSCKTTGSARGQSTAYDREGTESGGRKRSSKITESTGGQSTA